MAVTSHRRQQLIRASSIAIAVVLEAARLSAGQAVDPGRLEQLRVNVQAEGARIDAQPFAGAERVHAELEALRDEVGYLLVAQRRGQVVDDAECHALEARLQQVRRGLRHADTWPSSYAPADDELSLGAELDATLSRAVSSSVAKVEDRIDATTVAPVQQDGREFVPAGSRLRGTVVHVDRAAAAGHHGILTLVFDQITVRGRTYAIDASVVAAVLPRSPLVLGPHNTVVAPDGYDVDLPTGTVLTVRFESPLALTER